MILFVLVGPTAVGKTEISLQIAEYLGCPILNADSRQIYRDLPITTAAPTAAQRARVPHYFVATHGLEDPFSAARFEQEVWHLIAQHHSPMLLSGGSMLYIKAVTEGIDEMPEADPLIREALQKRYQTNGLQPLYEQLQALDPTYAQQVDRHNPQRIIHALEMCLTTGQPFSTFRLAQPKTRPCPIVYLGLQRERAALYARIDARVDEMLREGMIEETRAVYQRYADALTPALATVPRHPGPTEAQPIPTLALSSLNTVGLKEMLLYHAGIYSLPQAQERICHNTHVYSKKQMTWFKKMPTIHWFDPSQPHDEIFSFVKKCLQNHTN